MQIHMLYIHEQASRTHRVDMCERDISVTGPADLRLAELLVTPGKRIIEFLQPTSC